MSPPRPQQPADRSATRLHFTVQALKEDLCLAEIFERARSFTRASYLRLPQHGAACGEELVGLGCAWEATFGDTGNDTGFASANAVLRAFRHSAGDTEDVRLFAYAAFDPSYAPGDDVTWNAFERRALYLPELLLMRRDAQLFAVIAHLDHASPTAMSEWLARVNDAQHPAQPPATDGACTSLDLRNEETRFTANVASVVASAGTSAPVEKIVYARRATAERSSHFKLDRVIAALNADFSGCATFALSPHPGAPTFVGATPETLVSAHHNQLQTMALAGTTRGGSPPQSPERAAAEDNLLHSAKDRHEHQVVVEMITSSLKHHGASPSYNDTPGIRRLTNVSHLETPIRAEITDTFGLLEAIDALHPTPAVCGQPRQAARQAIARDEGFDRGLYAGPIGAMSPEGEGQIFVALRCGLVHHDQALLFAGAGITADSDPHVEWAETHQKLAALQNALTAEDLP
ncbi:isochorismate synthase [Bradymonadaceae bacterium TMQ3]|uniref:isochorismate synthase n=1 Tax=Lujinxingia sediminis TaxID=2480984 RepID=A0ABY0CZG1_9DELT|nr:isochorismate synthase [Lujinxingia sediminis]RDV39140.1 isochorismate synthase [Bradymonadaceae bacterium TMQ3]RVU48815.1 isochorismate synthase [Lujinxingia sediminis]TXC78108.1 isochorismate synthase [Bradymonadales bacterium TMQ1]